MEHYYYYQAICFYSGLLKKLKEDSRNMIENFKNELKHFKNILIKELELLKEQEINKIKTKQKEN